MQFNKEVLIVAVLLFVVIASGLDLYTDLSHGAPTSHLLKEAVVMILAIISIVWILSEQYQQSLQIRHLKQELSDLSAQPVSAYVLDARRKFSEVIQQQFSDWGLTDSEREVGWLLLKGLSLNEIAVIRDTLAKTVRQQASAIYKKAGVSGRHAFAAWFIEDLL